MNSIPGLYTQSLARRQFLKVSSLGLLGILGGCKPENEQALNLDQIIGDLWAQDPKSGLSAALIKGDQLIWSKGFGMADIASNKPMAAETIQNIGSISKTVTATAIMQLWEQEAFALDDDVNNYLPFSVRNPRFPDVPITFRQLLSHRSSITDGPVYDESYACGDPAVSLDDWIMGYFSPGGDYYDAEQNFHVWEPGTIDPPESPRAYSNVAFGLLGVLVEKISGTLFNEYCATHIFEPLGMSNTGWHLSEIDESLHAKLYSSVSKNEGGADDEMEELYLPLDGVSGSELSSGDLYPHCLYSFYNYPDGLVRTSVNDLSRFLRAYMNGGVFEGKRLLKAETIDLMLSHQHYKRGLCWDTYGEEEQLWGHGGGDPGIATFMAYDPMENVGVILFYNFGDFGEKTGDIVDRLLEAGMKSV
ncbi:MAG: serine hydrolase domain-containing protein [Rhodothermales bacterium]